MVPFLYLARGRNGAHGMMDADPLVALLTRLTASYQVDPADIEPAALERALKVPPSELREALARVVRLAATNRQLRGVRLPPLLISEEEEEACDDAQIARAVELRQGLSAEERAALDAVGGITVPQYEQQLRGTYGTVLGLRLNERAFKRALATCRTKRALKRSADHDASIALLHARLRALAAPPPPKKARCASPAEAL